MQTQYSLVDLIKDIFARFTSRKFIITFVVIYWVVTHPELTQEQLVFLLTSTGVFNLIEGASDFQKAKNTTNSHVSPPAGSKIIPNEPNR